METVDDGLKITENENGTFTLEWDVNDSKWSILNELSEDQIQSLITEGLFRMMQEYEE